MRSAVIWLELRSISWKIDTFYIISAIALIDIPPPSAQFLRSRIASYPLSFMISIFLGGML